MRGETRAWLELSYRLKKFLQETKRNTTSSEFVLWRVFFEERLNEPELVHYYLAQIAAEVRRVLAKNPKAITFKDFLLKFKTGKTPKSKAPTPEEVEKKTQTSKSYWGALLSFGKK